MINKAHRNHSGSASTFRFDSLHCTHTILATPVYLLVTITLISSPWSIITRKKLSLRANIERMHAHHHPNRAKRATLCTTKSLVEPSAYTNEQMSSDNANCLRPSLPSDTMRTSLTCSLDDVNYNPNCCDRFNCGDDRTQ